MKGIKTGQNPLPYPLFNSMQRIQQESIHGMNPRSGFHSNGGEFTRGD